MKVRTLFLLVILAAVCVFAALNWKTFTAPATLFLVFGSVEAPLGLVMLAFTALLTVVFILFTAFARTSALLEARRQERELQAMRQLAENAEASRFTILHDFLKEEVQKLGETDKGSGAEILARLDRLESYLKASIDESGNTLAAYIGELEDKIERSARPSVSGESA